MFGLTGKPRGFDIANGLSIEATTNPFAISEPRGLDADETLKTFIKEHI
jgi:hypothetical protein